MQNKQAAVLFVLLQSQNAVSVLCNIFTQGVAETEDQHSVVCINDIEEQVSFTVKNFTLQGYYDTSRQC
jgi:hypothetical protein